MQHTTTTTATLGNTSSFAELLQMNGATKYEFFQALLLNELTEQEREAVNYTEYYTSLEAEEYTEYFENFINEDGEMQNLGGLDLAPLAIWRLEQLEELKEFAAQELAEEGQLATEAEKLWNELSSAGLDFSLLRQLEGRQPVLYQYPQQHEPQKAYIHLYEDGAVAAAWAGETGVPFSIHYRRSFRFEISPYLSTTQILEFVHMYTKELETLKLGCAVEWDGANEVGVLSAEAEKAFEILTEAAENWGEE